MFPPMTDLHQMAMEVNGEVGKENADSQLCK